MFDNIGQKIKTLAIILCVAECVVAIIGGFIAIIVDFDFFFVALLGVTAACAAAYVSSFLLVGFGELIIRVCSIDEKLQGKGIEVVRQQVGVNPGVEKKAAPIRMPDYKCEYIKVSNSKAIGKCQECFEKNREITLCQIKCDLGVKERYLCDECKVRFAKNQSKA